MRITSRSISTYKDFSKNIAISFHAGAHGADKSSLNSSDDLDIAIYMLQTIEVQGKKFNLFFDSGCGDLVCKKSAVMHLEAMGRATKIFDGPITLSGVGNHKSICDHGVYSVKLPLHNGKDITLSGICLDKVTGEFPIYPLHDVESEIQRVYASKSFSSRQLPKLPHSVGGETDIMVGIQYLKYYAKKIFSLPNGLSIYE